MLSAPFLIVNAFEKSPDAVRQAHGPELRLRAALRSSFVIAAYVNVRLIPHEIARLASDYF
jgi:hypothetical protein